jgi:hypothetical protein
MKVGLIQFHGLSSTTIDKHWASMAERRLALPPTQPGALLMADLPKDRAALAEEHVTRAGRIVARQRKTIGEIRVRRGDCSEAEDLLSAFERSLTTFEDDLAAICPNPG